MALGLVGFSVFIKSLVLGLESTRIRQRGVCARQEGKEEKRRLRAWGVVRRAGVWSRVHESLWEPSIEPLAYLGGPRRSSGGKGHGPLVYPKVPIPRSPGLIKEGRKSAGKNEGK